jgi:hypothetical protein
LPTSPGLEAIHFLKPLSANAFTLTSVPFGLEACQCRKARIQRHHIGYAFLVWVRLNALASQAGQTTYQLKHGLLDDYLCQQLKKPFLAMIFT